MNIQKLKYFIDVAELGSVTKAAEKNCMSQAAMSQQMHSIEREINITLFMRKGRGLCLAPYSQNFVTTCKQILEIYSTAVSDVQKTESCGINSNEIIIGFLTCLNIDFLGTIVDRFNRIFPDVRIKLKKETLESIYNELKSADIDAAICPKDIIDFNSINMIDIYTDNLGVLMSSKNPIAMLDSVSFEQLSNECLILLSDKYTGHIHSGMFPTINKDNCISVDSIESLRSMVEFNQGYALLPEMTTKYKYNKSKMLHIIGEAHCINYVFAYNTSANKLEINHLAQLICEFLTNELNTWFASSDATKVT